MPAGRQGEQVEAVHVRRLHTGEVAASAVDALVREELEAANDIVDDKSVGGPTVGMTKGGINSGYVLCPQVSR